MPFAVFELAKLDGADFRNANLVRTQFTNANIQGADFSGADTRGALGLDLTGILTRNTIYPGGELHGISLVANEVWKFAITRFAMVFPGPFPIWFPLPIDYELFGTGENVWYPLYYPFPILIDSPLNLTTNGTLRLTFDGNEWYSTFRFAEDIAPALAGNFRFAVRSAEFRDGSDWPDLSSLRMERNPADWKLQHYRTLRLGYFQGLLHWRSNPHCRAGASFDCTAGDCRGFSGF